MQRETYDKSYRDFLPIIEELKKLIDKNKPLIIAIDGRCTSGKSSLGKLLGQVLDCNIFHMDDFFLPFEMKTRERLSQPGGNVHYERFEEEVLIALKNGKDVTYRPYSCYRCALDEPINIGFKNINIIEGSYSFHPTLQEAYDYKIFLTVDPKVQKERILKRNGEEGLQNFVNKWIPMEEYYFSSLNIRKQCDIVFDTSYLW